MPHAPISAERRLTRPGAPLELAVVIPTRNEAVIASAAAVRRGPQSRFLGWRPWPARLVLAIVAALALYGASLGLGSDGHTLVRTGGDAETSQSDLGLYRAITDRVTAGEGYYAAAAAEHRQRSYPLRPSVAVRLPTLVHLHGWLGEAGAAILLGGLVLAAMTAVVRRLRTDLPGHQLWPTALALAGLIPTLILPMAPLWHEFWAASLIVLSLAVRKPENYVPSLCFGLAAVSIRELAMPYLLVMAVLAWWEGRRHEAAAWSGAILLALALVALHATQVAAVTLPGDLASQGWASVGGWPFLVALMRSATSLASLPLSFAGLLVPFCLLGWVANPTPFGSRVALMTIGYVAAFTLVGRPDNWYWGLLIAPLFLAGLAFVPAALRDLWRAARPA